MNPNSSLTRILAFVCTLCPFCVLRRRFPHSAYGRFMRRIERGCVFCRAYDCTHGNRGGAGQPAKGSDPDS